MRQHTARLGAAITLLLLTPAPTAAGPLTPSSSESSALKALAAKIPKARLLWVRGGRVIHAAASKGFKAEVVTQGSITEVNPRWSPDGSKILTVRSDGVYVMNADFSGATKVIPGGQVASWTRDGKSITCIDQSEYKVLRYDLAQKTTKTIYDAKQSPYNGQQVAQAAELRKGGRFLLVFRSTPGHVTEIVDLQLKKYIANSEMKRGDCSPAWAPDGSYILNTARLSSRPVLRAMFSVSSSGGSVSASKHFVGLATGEKFYIHGQRVSNDGKWVAFGGKIFGGSLKSALREIYIWPVGGKDKDAVRVSFDTSEDQQPSLHISPGTSPPPPPPPPPKLALGPTSLAFSATEGGAAPSSKTVTVKNDGGGTLAAVGAKVSFGTGSGWLAVKKGGSGNSQTLENSVDIGGLQPDTYSATVKVSASGASNSPQSYTVSLTVKAKAPPPADKPAISLKPTSLSLVAGQGGPAPPPETVAVGNAGKGTLAAVTASIKYVSGSGWLAVKAGGSGDSQTIVNSVDIGGLQPDTYSATVKVSAGGASNSPQSYTVSLTVNEKPGPAPTPDSGPPPPVADTGGPAPDDGAAPAGELGPTPPSRDGGSGTPLSFDDRHLQGGCSVGGPASAPGFVVVLLLVLVRRRFVR